MRLRPFHYRLAGLAVVVGMVGAALFWWHRTTRPDYVLKQGLQAARANDLERAELYAIQLETSGHTDHFLVLRAELLLRHGQPTRALAAINRITTEGPLRIDAAEIGGRILVVLKKPREAEKALLFAISHRPNLVEAHRQLAIIYYDQGDMNRALGHLQEVAKLDPTDPRPHRLIGLIFKDLDQNDDAIPAYQEAIRRQPEGPDVAAIKLELGEAYIKNYQEAEALAILEGLDQPDAYALRAEAMIPLGRGDDATALLDDALKKYPNYGGLLRLRAERYRAANQVERAVPLFEKVLAADAHDYRSRNQLALCLESLGRTAEAADHHRRVKETQALIEDVHERNKEAMANPWDPVVREKLAALCDKLNRPQLARMWREAARACRDGKPPAP